MRSLRLPGLSRMLGGGGNNVSQPFPINLFTGGAGVAIQRIGGDYIIHQEFADREALSLYLTSATVGAATFHSVRDCKTSKLYRLMDDTEGTLTGAWTTTNNAAYYGGSRISSATAGRKIAFTLPAYAQDVFWKVVTSNAGIMRVTIGGDATRADLVTTAQQLVDAGYAEATVLVANGGTLNPTDRCFDPKTNTSPAVIQLASNLSGGEVIEFEVTGYKNPTSSNAAVYVDAIGVRSPMPTANYTLANETLMPLSSSVMEIASNLLPAGATNKAWVGNSHGNDYQVSLTLYVNGVEVTPADGSFTVGTQVKAVRVSKYRHPETGDTEIADTIQTYTANLTGIDIETQITWLVNGLSGNTRAPMWALTSQFDRGTTELSTGNYTLSANDDSTVGNDLSLMVWAWDLDGTLGALLTVPAGQAVRAQIEDRSGSPAINKIYYDYCIVDTNFAASDVWTIRGNYRLQRFAGAETSLAK